MLGFTEIKNQIYRRASRWPELPMLGKLAQAMYRNPSAEDLEGFYHAQDLAIKAVCEVAELAQPGWTEKQLAEMVNIWLKDHGVRHFFHYAYAWCGERTRYDGINIHRYHEFEPTDRVLQENEVFILDVAPIVAGYTSDVGLAFCKGDQASFQQALVVLGELHQKIPQWFDELRHGADVCRHVASYIKDHGYDVIHHLYPFSVLGHRLFPVKLDFPFEWKLFNFGVSSYWEMLSRGVFGQLLNEFYEGNIQGIWAIEPHLGAPEFGVKFEEILVVPGETKPSYWLSSQSYEDQDDA